MIRIFIGFFMVIGSVGTQDLAMEMGVAGPPLYETMLYCLIGIVIAGSAVPKLIRQGDLG